MSYFIAMGKSQPHSERPENQRPAAALGKLECKDTAENEEPLTRTKSGVVASGLRAIGARARIPRYLVVGVALVALALVTLALPAAASTKCPKRPD